MAAASALITLLLTDPTLPLPESTWDIVALGAILIVEATGSATATAMTTIETGTGTETVTVIALPVVTTGTVVTGTRRAGVTEGAPVAIRPIARREEAILAAQLRGAHDVLVNVAVTAINPKVLVVFCNRPPSWDPSRCRYQVIKFRDPFTVLYQDFKLKLFRQLA